MLLLRWLARQAGAGNAGHAVNDFRKIAGIESYAPTDNVSELTARTKYRGLVKKRLFPVRIEGALPFPGTIVELEGQDVGELRSGAGARASAAARTSANGTAASAAA